MDYFVERFCAVLPVQVSTNNMVASKLFCGPVNHVEFAHIIFKKEKIPICEKKP